MRTCCALPMIQPYTWLPHGLQMANRLLFNESPRTAGAFTSFRLRVVRSRNYVPRMRRSIDLCVSAGLPMAKTSPSRILRSPTAIRGYSSFRSKHWRARRSSTTSNAWRKYFRLSLQTERNWPMRVLFLRAKVSSVCRSSPQMVAGRGS